MASAGEIRAGKAYIEIGERGLAATITKIKALGDSFTNVGSKVSSTGTSIMGYATAALAPLGASVKMYGTMGAELQALSKRTGMTVEELQELQFAANKTGVEFAALAEALPKMNKLMGDASVGNSEAIDKLNMLKLGLGDLKRATPMERFKMFSDAINKFPNPAQRAYLATKLFEDGGVKLLGMLELGSAGLTAYQEKARQLGLVLGGDDVKAAAEFNGMLSDVWTAVKMVVFHVGGSLVPVLKELIPQFLNGAKNVGDWIKNNQALVVTFAKFAAGAFAVGAGLFAVGKVISFAGFAIGGLAPLLKIGGGALFGIARAGLAAFSGIKALFGVLTMSVNIGAIFSTVISTVASALGTMGTFLLGLLSPVGLITAAIVGITAALVGYVAYQAYTIGETQNTTTSFSQLWSDAKADFSEAWGGIVDAIKSGDIGAALTIAWSFIKLEWKRGILWLEEKWIAFADGFKTIWIESVYSVAGALTKALAGIQSGIAYTTAFFKQAWATVLYWFQNAWSASKNFVSKGWIWVKEKLGVIDENQANQAREEIQKQAEAEDKARTEQFNKDMDDIEERRNANLNAIEAERAGTLQALEEDKQRKQDERQARTQAELKALQDEAQQARQNFKDKLNDLKQLREGEKQKGYTSADGVFHPAQQGDWKDTSTGGGAVGTFSAYAVGGLAMGKPEIVLLTAIAQNTKKMAGWKPQRPAVAGA